MGVGRGPVVRGEEVTLEDLSMEDFMGKEKFSQHYLKTIRN